MWSSGGRENDGTQWLDHDFPRGTRQLVPKYQLFHVSNECEFKK